MEEAKQLEMIHETQQNVAILGKDVEFIKRDLNEFKTDIKRDISEFKKDSKEQNAEINSKLEKLINEPQESLKFFKNKIFSLIISGVAILVVLGFGTYCMSTINEANQIVQQYEQQVQE